MKKRVMRRLVEVPTNIVRIILKLWKYMKYHVFIVFIIGEFERLVRTSERCQV